MMTILRWDPMEDFDSLRREMMRVMDSTTPMRWVRNVRAGGLGLPLDAYVTDEEIVITAAVPGMNPDDVDITLEGDTLTITGELNPPLENVEYLFQERPFGTFTRKITINVPVVVEDVEAKFANGVLTIVLPKAQEARPKVIKIKAE